MSVIVELSQRNWYAFQAKLPSPLRLPLFQNKQEAEPLKGNGKFGNTLDRNLVNFLLFYLLQELFSINNNLKMAMVKSAFEGKT